MNLEKGSIIQHYKIISAIGKGGMGEVFLAQDTKLNRKVELKILSPEFAEFLHIFGNKFFLRLCRLMSGKSLTFRVILLYF